MTIFYFYFFNVLATIEKLRLNSVLFYNYGNTLLGCQPYSGPLTSLSPLGSEDEYPLYNKICTVEMNGSDL